MLFTEAAFSFFDSTFSAVAIDVSFCPRGRVSPGRYRLLMLTPAERALILFLSQWSALVWAHGSLRSGWQKERAVSHLDADEGDGSKLVSPTLLTSPIHQWRVPPAAHR